MMTHSKIYSHTEALCPECKAKVPARIIQKNNEILLEKFCKTHGYSDALLSNDIQWYEDSRNYVKPGQIPLKINKPEFKGCPDSCGFCSEHQQHTCLTVIEINSACNMDCPVCLKPEDISNHMKISEFENIIDNLIATEGKVDVVNISGGEPTIHPNLIEFIDIAQRKGILQISISTNGLELLNNQYLRTELKNRGAIVALQFDGFKRDTYIQIRGVDYSAQKLQLIEILERENVLYSLVSTIAKNINDNEINDITDFFFRSKALTIMFQPLAFTGSATKFDVNSHRITIPDVVKKIENSKFVKKGDFNPLPCSHYSCFALAYFLKIDEDNYLSLKEFLGDNQYLDLIANKTLPGLENEGFSVMKHQLYELWSASDSSNMNDMVLKRIKTIIKELECCGFSPQKALSLGMQNMKAIFIHHFMDVYNFDFSRLVKCCNPYPRSGDKLIPACAENI